MIGIDRAKMRLFDIEMSQQNIVDSNQTLDLFAEPVFGESNLIYLLVRSDGTVGVPLDKNGLYAGEEVTVYIND